MTERSEPSPVHDAPAKWNNSTVIGAGITSALGDFSYETANVILPGFLAVLGVSPSALGLIEGIADAMSSFAKMGAGWVSDRLGVRKSLVVAGYALTVVGQGLMALAVGWWLFLLGRVVGWFGRGIRGPLRDAIVAESITPETKGRAFGFHRTADTIGAVVGPLIGVAMLSFAQDLYPESKTQPFRFVFWLTLVPGVLAVLSFTLLVKDDQRQANPTLRFWSALKDLPAPFRRYLVAVGMFGIGDFAHTLLILAATTLLTPAYGVLRAAQIAGLLYVVRNLVQTLSSFPIGVLADSVGHRIVLVAGYALGALTAALTVVTFSVKGGSLPLLVGVFILAGLYVAVQEALEPTVTSELVPVGIRGIGYGMLGTVNGIGKLVSSAVVGLLWTAVSPVFAFNVASILMALGTFALLYGLLPTSSGADT